MKKEAIEMKNKITRGKIKASGGNGGGEVNEKNCQNMNFNVKGITPRSNYERKSGI